MKFDNPYQKIFDSNRVALSSTTNLEQAEKLCLHLSLIYNTFGSALKDVIGLMSHLYPAEKGRKSDNPSENIKSKPKQTIAMESDKTGSIKRQMAGELRKSREIIEEQEQRKEFDDFSKYVLNLDCEIQKTTKLQKTIGQSVEQRQRMELPRKKKDREAFSGYSCIQCESFYKVLGEDDSKSRSNRLCEETSRHKSNLPPTDYFNNFTQQFGFDQ